MSHTHFCHISKIDSDQDLSTLAYAYATLQQPAPALFEAIARELLSKRHALRPTHLSEITFAFVTLRAHQSAAAADLFEALADAAREQLPLFSPHHLVTLLWAYAQAGYAPAHRSLFDQAAPHALLRIGGFSPRELSAVVSAFGLASHAHPQLFEAVASRALQIGLHRFPTQKVVDLLHGFASVQHEATALFESAAASFGEGCATLPTRQLALLAWSYAAASPPPTDALHSLFGSHSPFAYALRLSGRVPPTQLLTLRHIWQWVSWRGRCGDAAATWAELPPELHARAEAAYVSAEAARKTTSSSAANSTDLVSQVEQVLREDLKLVPLAQAPLSDGMYADLLVEYQGRKVAVEVDGRERHLANTNSYHGEAALRKRQLRHAGWMVLPVPYYEWIGAGHADETVQRRWRAWYLQSALEALVTANTPRDATGG